MHRLIARSSLPAVFAATACAAQPAQPSADDPVVFGGQGASIVEPDTKPLPEVEDKPTLTGACATPPPAGEDLLLDDFEDGDNQVFKVFRREGWWYTASDGTQGEEVFPPKSKFAAEPLPEAERSADNEMAAHMWGRGMTDWGATWGMTLSWVNEGVRCPFNASKFTGIAFRARGTGTVQFRVGTIGTQPRDNGGVCEDHCWDLHSKTIRLSEAWTRHEVRFDRLQQGGWGQDVRFDPERILSVVWAAPPADLPVDFWLDDIEFITDGAAP